MPVLPNTPPSPTNNMRDSDICVDNIDRNCSPSHTAHDLSGLPSPCQSSPYLLPDTVARIPSVAPTTYLEGKAVSTGFRGVSCSYESLKCYHVLRILVKKGERGTVFQPTVVEDELFRFIRAINFLPQAHTRSSSAAKDSEADMLAKYLNDQVLSTYGGSMEVMGYFGKQSAVKKQLELDGWWPRDLSNHIIAEEEGVYILLQETLNDVDGGIRLVLFGWLVENSFEGSLLREHATYVLRFLTTLTSNVVCCLTPLDITLTEQLMQGSVKAKSSKKYSVSLSIQTSKVQEEQVRCDLKYTGQWDDEVKGGKLISSNMISLVVEKVEEGMTNQQGELPVDAPDQLAQWFIDVMKTYNIDVQCQIPHEWKSTVLELLAKFPHDEMKRLEDDIVEKEAQNQANLTLKAIQKRCEENAKIAYDVKTKNRKEKKSANASLEEDLQIIDGWLGSIGIDPFTRKWSYRGDIERCVNEEHGSLCAKTKPKEYFFSSKKNGRMKKAVNNSKGELKTMCDAWCQSLRECLGNPKITEIVKNQQNMNQGKIKVAEMVNNRKEATVHAAFQKMIDEHNGSASKPRLVTVLKSVTTKVWPRSNSNYLNFTQQQLADVAKMVYIYRAAKSDPQLYGLVSLPLHAHIVLISIIDDICVLVYVVKTDSTVKTHVEAFKNKSSIKPMELKKFQRETSLCDFDPSHRLLALLHSDTVVEIYAFNESYTKLEWLHTLNLLNFSLQSPYNRLMLFGGDNHGLTVVDNEGSLQSYFIRSKQNSELAKNFIVVGNTKLVNVQGGAVLSLLPMDEINAEVYAVKVRTILSADNSELPETTLELPLSMEWRRCSVSCAGETLVCFDPKTAQVRMWSLHIATGKIAWKLKGSKTTRGESNPLETHPMWSFFHLFEKFPVESLVAKSNERTLVSSQLQLHVPGVVLGAAVTNLLTLIMHKLQSLNKDLSSLNLEDDLQTYSSGCVP
ncbi:hypothetical protein AC1031_002091 [Aphanomyces cochlioides]|nr:hypothetical protein AC1031_002091 [Aphanomyces cochlioides]